MHTVGLFSPETVANVRERYEQVGPTAQVMVKETAKAMGFDSEEYEQRVTSSVVERARDVLFASLLAVRVGTREEFEQWCDRHSAYEVAVVGSEHVDHVVWHAAPFAEQVVAATFQNEERAAVETLRRQAFGRIYRDAISTADATTNTEMTNDETNETDSEIPEAETDTETPNTERDSEE